MTDALAVLPNRDWLYVRTRSWVVYGLIDPTTKAVFYVGITNRSVRERLNQHRKDRSSAVWDVIRHLEQECVFAGVKYPAQEIEHCEFALVFSEEAARHLETALIAVLPQIYNRTHGREGVGFWRPFAHDCWLIGGDKENRIPDCQQPAIPYDYAHAQQGAAP
jgi:hypothetical protein